MSNDSKFEQLSEATFFAYYSINFLGMAMGKIIYFENLHAT